MFETVVRKEPSILAYGVQQFAAPLVPLIAVLIFSPVFGILPGRAQFIGDLLFGLSIAFLLGRTVRAHRPETAEAGRWVWVIPSFVFLAGLISDSVHFKFRYALKELFYPSTEGEAALAFVLITIPVFSSIGYSIGCFKTEPRDRQTAQ